MRKNKNKTKQAKHRKTFQTIGIPIGRVSELHTEHHRRAPTSAGVGAAQPRWRHMWLPSRSRGLFQAQTISALMWIWRRPFGFFWWGYDQRFLLIGAVAATCRVCRWQDYSVCVCVFRWRAGAGGEAALAIQRLPAGAERVPAAATQTPQVPLHGHVTPSVTCAGRQGGREDAWLVRFVSSARRNKDKAPLGLVVGAVTLWLRPPRISPPSSSLLPPWRTDWESSA